MFCKYRHIFGKEREGPHSIRLFDVAIVDLGLTVVGGILLARFMHWNVLLTLGVLFILGIIMHRLFCVNTKINQILFGRVSASSS